MYAAFLRQDRLINKSPAGVATGERGQPHSWLVVRCFVAGH
jgi:hypothetical protein